MPEVPTGDPLDARPRSAGRNARIRRVLLGPPRTPAHLRTRPQRVAAWIGGSWDVGAYAYLALAGVVAASRRAGGVAPTVLQPLQAVYPLVMLPAAAVAVVALARRRGLQLLFAVVLAASGWFAVRPAWRSHRLTAPDNRVEVTFLQANVYVNNTDPAAVARMVLDRDTDVVALEEFTQPFDDAFSAAGVYDAYPYRVVRPRTDAGGAALLSKLPFDDATAPSPTALPEVLLDLAADVTLRVIVMHPFPPLDSAAARTWTSTLERLASRVPAAGEPTVAIGDFNGTRWQPAFGAVLGAGARDAHEELGRGLSFSWPVGHVLPPFARLDHALVWKGAVPTQVLDVEVPGSDHRGFEATIAVRAADR